MEILSRSVFYFMSIILIFSLIRTQNYISRKLNAQTAFTVHTVNTYYRNTLRNFSDET